MKTLQQIRQLLELGLNKPNPNRLTLMPKIFSVTTYKYAELSDEAKEKARDWFREGKTEHYSWADESLASLKALAEHFHGTLKDYDIDFTGDYSHSSATFEMPETTRQDIADKLTELGSYDAKTLKGHGDAKLTGYSPDDEAIDGFRIAFYADRTTYDLEKLMQAAFESWLKYSQADCKQENSDEAVAKSIEANEYDFTAEGKRSVTVNVD